MRSDKRMLMLDERPGARHGRGPPGSDGATGPLPGQRRLGIVPAQVPMSEGDAGRELVARPEAAERLPRDLSLAVARVGWLAFAGIGAGVAIVGSVVAAILLGPWLGLDLQALPATMAVLLVVSLVLVMPGLAVTLRLVQHLVQGQQRLEEEIRQRAQAETRLRELAARDDLTGLANRRSFVDSGHKLAALCHRHDRWLALMILDLDGFKEANDRRGHQAGDRLLQRLARILLTQIRQSDIAARLGGDEFAVMLPDSDIGQAALAAERIREAIESDCRLDGLTASIGVAASRGERADLDDLLARSDRVLYAAKRQGRNRVVAAPAVPGARGEVARSRPTP